MHGLLALLAWAPAFAWSSLGHRVVARIAEDRLSLEGRQLVTKLFGAPDALETISACPDAMLASTATVQCGRGFDLAPDADKKTAPWHFINLPAESGVAPDALAGWCPAGACVVDAIRAQLAILGRADATDQERRVAVMYLVHFVGDEHQPLHCADDGDRGGNTKLVTLGGESFKLHELWDGLLHPLKGRRGRRSPKPAVRDAERLIKRTDVSSWTRGDFVADAAVESHDVARESIYPAYRESGGRVDAAYVARFEPVVTLRLAKAGVRLAALLDKALTGKAP